MKKPLIALIATLALLALGAGAIVIAEHRARAQLEAQVQDHLGECGITPTRMDVRGRPYLLSALEERAQLTYADLAPATGASRDQLLIRELSGGRAEHVSRLITLPYPSPDAAPLPRPDGAFSDRARVDGSPVTVAGSLDEGRLRITADGDEVGELPVPAPAELAGVFANEDGIVAEVDYPAGLCG